MESVRQRILREHRDTIAAVVDAGTAVARAIESWPVTDSATIRLPLERFLRENEVLPGLLDVLDTGASGLGAEVQGNPVAAPPYLVVTSRGPVCRGTLADGRRLVIEFPLFGVESRPRRYRFLDPDPAECLRLRCD